MRFPLCPSVPTRSPPLLPLSCPSPYRHSVSEPLHRITPGQLAKMPSIWPLKFAQTLPTFPRIIPLPLSLSPQRTQTPGVGHSGFSCSRTTFLMTLITKGRGRKDRLGDFVSFLLPGCVLDVVKAISVRGSPVDYAVMISAK